jgi:hypothetical protein
MSNTGVLAATFLTVLARRGGDASPSEVAALWDALSERERRTFLWLPSFLPLSR